MQYLVTSELEPISSTEIRKRLKNGGHLESLMHPAAAAYLRENIKYEILKKLETEERQEEQEREEEKKAPPVIISTEKSYLEYFWRCTIV